MRDIFVYDVLAHLRRNPEKAKRVQEILDNIATIERQVLAGKADHAQQAAEMAKLVPLCGFNFGMLLPYVYPRYPSTRPLSLMARPFMFAMTCLAGRSVLTLRAGRQVGKCADRDTRVSTRDHGCLTLGQLFDLGGPVISDVSSA